ncbi:hypothetical protein N7520_008666 [Penicillium odoratum]|uniref:uncharacterized protein n=1 Tax=Penicillium odoratum TaxID=1167516 RepID=UPI0025496330|nr:uncharacterized protein N7520_008666 [Penicillium odoratum]KAJ5751749.1 hypothetical protein N7520_008666 [Penicillium odoratum]
MSESPQLLPDGPTDTPFQLLKLYEYWNFLPEGEVRQNVPQQFLGQAEDNIAFQWMQALDRENKRGFFAWPHGHRDGIVYFRLDDHVWIWNAISAIAIMFEWTQASFFAKGSKINKKADIPKWETEWKNLARTYDPDRVKREITQRFTTINDPAKQRMLAVTRSSRETRFAFHSRDTALFYEINDKRMLDETDPRWYSAMEIQRYFFSNLEWGETDNPLYHGLNLLLALQRGQPGADKLFQRSKDIIEKSILINGLIPDQLDSAGGEEDASYHRDLLLNIPFETLYLLSGPGKGEFPSLTHEQRSHTAADGFPDSATQRLERTVPFNEKIDENNIVNVKEEWLYNSPPFFEFDPSEFIQEQFNPELGETTLMTLIPEQERLHQVSPFQLYQDTIFRASLDWFDAHESKISQEVQGQSYEPKIPQSAECQHMMIDVQKKKSRAKKARQLNERMSQYDTIGDSWKRLKQLRDMDTAKKRLLWFQNAPRDYALMCFLVSPPSERQPIRTFFNRHASSAVLVEDKTSRIRNMWETEFHCGFLQLVETGKDAPPVLTCEMLRLAMDELPKFESHRLVRAAASFRFCGDFFDRFWTGHFIESYPGEPLEGNIRDFFGQDNKRLEGLFSGGRQHVWQQRKILELLLFYRILTHVNKSTRSITDIIREKLAVKTGAENRAEGKKGSLDPYDTAVYFESLKKWASLHEVLEILDEQLDRVWENTNAWETREQDRRTEQPRWTSKDERKYRDALNHVLLLSQNAQRELHSERAKTASLIKSLQYQSDEAKNNYDRHMTERSFQQNDNVKYFTYATVIFQPLAFAASIYSMQSSPPTDVLQHMVICSVVAFIVLLIIVVSLPFLLRPIQNGLWRPTQVWRLLDRNSEVFIWWLKVVTLLTTQGLLFSRDFFAVLSSLRSMRQSSKPKAEKGDVESGLKDGEQSKAISMSYLEAVAIIREQRGQIGRMEY